MTLTPADVSAVFHRHSDPAAFVSVKGGDFQKAGVYQQRRAPAIRPAPLFMMIALISLVGPGEKHLTNGRALG